MKRPPWQESSTTSSPVKLFGEAKTVAIHSSSRAPVFSGLLLFLRFFLMYFRSKSVHQVYLPVLISDGSPKIFFSSVYCWIFIALIVVVIIGILRGKMKETKNAKVEQ